MLVNQPGDGFQGQEHGSASDANCARWDYVSVEKNKIEVDPAATDERVPDAPAAARPKMEENDELFCCVLLLATVI